MDLLVEVSKSIDLERKAKARKTRCRVQDVKVGWKSLTSWQVKCNVPGKTMVEEVARADTRNGFSLNTFATAHTFPAKS